MFGVAVSSKQLVVLRCTVFVTLVAVAVLLAGCGSESSNSTAGEDVIVLPPRGLVVSPELQKPADRIHVVNAEMGHYIVDPLGNDQYRIRSESGLEVEVGQDQLPNPDVLELNKVYHPRQN